jgi:accessory secretory protein Asp3
MKTDVSIIYSVRWDNLANESYLYGSSIAFKRDGTVRFSNLLMPPGQIIRRWQSDVNYQGKRHEPQLPILEEGEKYEIRTYAHCEPDGGVKLRIRFFDRQGEENGTVIIDNSTDDLVCPPGASGYELELINAGAKEFVFHHIEIQKKSECERNVRIIYQDGPIHVLILEPTGSSYIFPKERLLGRLKNRVILTCEGADALDFNSCITDRLPEDLSPDRIVVIGYGKHSNESAAGYARKIGSGVKLYTYGSAPRRMRPGIENIIYGNSADVKDDTVTSLIAPLCDRTDRLSELSFR